MQKNSDDDSSNVIQTIDSEMASVIKAMQQQKFSNEIKTLEELKRTKGKAAATFKLRDSILGAKKNPLEPIILIDPITGEEVNTPNEIKRVSVEFCERLLRNREPKDEYSHVIKSYERLHTERMQELIEGDIDELPLSAYNRVLEIIKKKPGEKYQFIKKAGSSFHEALFKLFQIVWKTEKIPDLWYESTITQLQKGKGRLGDLSFMRHIHDKKEYFKFFSLIVTSFAKENIFNNMSKFQIACRPGHRPSEHLFVLKSVFALYNSRKQGLIISSFDLKSFFDTENLFDCMNELYRSEVKGKTYRLMFQMNKKAYIKVKTPVGVSQSKETGPCF